MYFSYVFLGGLKHYYFGKKSFRNKVKNMEDEAVKGTWDTTREGSLR